MQIALVLLLLGVRVVSTLTDGRSQETTGMEGVHAAVVRRVAAGGPLYQDINRDSTTAIYNYGFYRVYAAVAAALPTKVPVLSGLRLFSLAMTFGAVIALAAIVAHRLPGPSTWPRLLTALALAVPSVLGPFSGWLPLSVRPDLPAFALEFAGLALVERSGNRVRMLLGAGVLFGLAIAIKQNAVACLLFATLSVVLGRCPRRAGWLWVGILGAAVVGIATSGPFYLHHTVFAPAATHMDAASFAQSLTDATRAGLPMLAAGLALGAWRRTRNPDAPLPLAWLILIAIGLSVPQLARFGSGRNYLIGAFAIASVTVWLHALSSRTRVTGLLATTAASLQLLITAAYLPPFNAGTLRLPPASEELRAGVARAGADGEPPHYTDDPAVALAWTGSATRLEVTDPTVYADYVGSGAVTEPAEARIARCVYGTLLLRGADLAGQAMAVGYSVRERWPEGRVWLTRDRCAAGDGPPQALVLD